MRDEQAGGAISIAEPETGGWRRLLDERAEGRRWTREESDSTVAEADITWDLATLCALLKHASPDIRRQAIESCATLGPPAAPAAAELLAIYAVEDDDLWIEAATALARIGAAAIAPLADMLHHPEPRLRKAALEMLGSLCPPESEVRERMAALLDDEDAGVRHAAGRLLVTCGENSLSPA